jgi:hypothetical protein
MNLSSQLQIPDNPGPVIIIGRPHSGSRMLARLFLDNGLFMGADLSPDFLDSISWYQRFVVPLMTSCYFPDWHLDDDSLKKFSSQLLLATWPDYRGGCHERVSTWGWKFCETLFVIPIIRLFFPSARFVHIIRDSRDVCLSDNGFFQFTGSHRNPPGWNSPLSLSGKNTYQNFCLATTFGRNDVQEWRGFNVFDRRTLVEHRFLFQAKSWVTCVERAKIYGQDLGEDYIEIRYEDFCLNPVEEANRLFKWLGLPLRASAVKQLENVRCTHIGKWRNLRMSSRELRDFEEATALAAPLLSDLGYEF